MTKLIKKEIERKKIIKNDFFIISFSRKEQEKINDYYTIKEHDFENFVFHALYLFNDYKEFILTNDDTYYSFEKFEEFLCIKGSKIIKEIDKRFLYHIINYYGKGSMSENGYIINILKDLFFNYSIIKEDRINDIVWNSIYKWVEEKNNVIWKYLLDHYNEVKEKTIKMNFISKDIFQNSNDVFEENIYDHLKMFKGMNLWKLLIMNIFGNETLIRKIFIYPAFDKIIEDLFSDFRIFEREELKKLLKRYINEYSIMDLFIDMDMDVQEIISQIGHYN